MSDSEAVLPEVQRALHDAIVQGKVDTRQWIRRPLFVVPAVVLALGSTALAATGAWRPLLGNERLGHPTSSRSEVPAEQLQMLGVLRRPQTDADRGPQVENMLRNALSNRSEAGGVTGVRTDSIRRIAATSKSTWIMVPVKRVAAPKRVPGTANERDMICVLMGEPPSSGKGFSKVGYGRSCRSTQDIALGRLAGGAAFGRHLQLWGVVPDGVAKVKARLRGGNGITATVRDNAYVIDATIPERAWIGHYIWYDRNGSELRRR